MSLKDKISGDLVAAIKSGNPSAVSTLRLLSSAIKNKEIEKSSKLADDDVMAVVSSEIKKRKDAANQYEKGGRNDLAKKEMSEIEVLKQYAPLEMPEEELRAIIKKKIIETETREFGKIIGSVMGEVKGRADGAAVKKIIEEELGEPSS